MISSLYVFFELLMPLSQKTAENCTLYFSWKTPMEKIDELEKCINDWLSVEENRWYQPSTGIVFQNISNQNYLEVTIVIPHNRSVDWKFAIAFIDHVSPPAIGKIGAYTTK